MKLTRRQFLAASAALPLVGCGHLPRFTGGLVGADAALGHRMRDGDFPSPTEEVRARVVIIGGGIAGLSAARELVRRGVEDFVLLELDAQAGGNSASSANAVSAYPWGAHYVPLPGADATEVLALFRELGVITGQDAAGRPIYREEFLTHDPVERLFIHGRWQEGIVPQLGLNAEERAQSSAFFARVEELRSARGDDGRPLFTIPLDHSSRDPRWLALDRQTLAAWLAANGFTAAPLRWYVDYCCRDDFGAGADVVSAWAGLHYFASRSGEAANAPAHSVVTWPAGNGWLAQQLRAPLRAHVRPLNAVWRVEPTGDTVLVDSFDVARGRSVRYRADSVVCATPRFVSDRMLARGGLTVAPVTAVYSPWMVANLTLDRLPSGRGADLAWDNVFYDSQSLGYVVATHQHLHPFPRATVLTYYLPLDHAEPAVARREARQRSYADWCDLILADLSRAHPDLRRHLTHLDVMVWGHGMVTPVPGFIWGEARAQMLKPAGRVHFAHSDMSGISIFEEAYTRGVQAAAAVAKELEAAA